MKNQILENQRKIRAIHDQLVIPGVKPEDVVLLFNVSNFPYYLRQVGSLLSGMCQFCHLDTEVNEELPYNNRSWMVFTNKVAPRAGQVAQLVIVSRRHITDSDELQSHEVLDLHNLKMLIKQKLKSKYGITGCVFVERDGDPFFTAGSMRHKHINVHITTGVDDVRVTLGKSLKKIEAKLAVLLIFEKMRLMLEAGDNEPWTKLPANEFDLIAEYLAPPKLAA